MMAAPDFEIFLVATPGLEQPLCDEAREQGFSNARIVSGGVTMHGNWRDVWRANLELRGATRVLARIASFRAAHLAQLDKRSRAVPWKDYLRADVTVRVEATCRKSRIYHSGAAAQRIATAIREEHGCAITDDAIITVMARIENDLVTISIDTSGDLLHRRGSKQAMAKAPMRETMAAMFLRQCGFSGQEPVLDPMCGSGTFVIEAAEIAARLKPGRHRTFAFEQLATLDAAKCAALRDAALQVETPFRFYGSDRDAGAIRSSIANAERAGVSSITKFECKPIGDIALPAGPTGLVIMNPPYGARIGDKRDLANLYAAIGNVLRQRFAGWRVGLIATDEALVRKTGMKFRAGPPVLHGGIRIKLYQAEL